MLQQIGHRDFHHIGKWLGVQAHEKHCDGQQGHDREFTRVDVGEFFDVVIGDGSQINAFEHPQGVGSTKDQRRRCQQSHREVIFHSAQNNHPVAHKAGRTRQTTVGHGEQQRKGCKLGHGVDHSAIA